MNKLKLLFSATLVFLSLSANASSNLQLSIQGENFNVERTIQIGAPGSEQSTVEFDFHSKNQRLYSFKLEYKKLPTSRSYPSNLDITISDSEGKIGYLFFALNDLTFLESIGSFGLKLETSDGKADIQFNSTVHDRGNLDFNLLGDERFFQDTLLENKGFQMIRPVALPITSAGIRQKEFPLDSNPYSVEFQMLDRGNGRVRFEHNFYAIDGGIKSLALGVYFNAKTLSELREAMFAAKHFRLKE